MVQESQKSGNPKKRKASTLEKIVDEALAIVFAKGWHAEIDSLDKDGGRFASISVERNFSRDRTITGNFEISLINDSLRIKRENTSFYSNGLSDLQDSIWNGLEEKGYIGKKGATKEPTNSRLSTDIDLLCRVLRRFHRSVRQLKHRYADRSPLLIADEFDVQDYLHAILRALFDDVRAEEYTPSYAGGASRIDFLLKSEGIAIEVKMATAKLRDRKIGEELLIDIQRYQAHPSTNLLVCFVYDPDGEVRNPTGLEADLSKLHDKLDVRVLVISPS